MPRGSDGSTRVSAALEGDGLHRLERLGSVRRVAMTPKPPLAQQTRAAVLYGPGDLRVETLDVPPPGPDEVRLQVAFSGICGTDLHYWDGWKFDAWFPERSDPWVPGHEFSAAVQAVGPGVDDLAPGDLVVVEPNTGCEDCPTCDRGLVNFCPNKAIMARGAWADHVNVGRRHVFPLPGAADPRLASLTEPLACVVRGFDRVTAAPGDTVLIAGAGPIGLLALQLAKHQGAAQTLVSEPIAARRALADTLGADHVLDPAEDDPAAAARDLTNGGGADVTIEAAGANAALQACLDSVRDSGVVLILSVGNPAARFDLRPFDFFAREISIIGSNTRVHTFQRALDLIPRLNLAPIITHEFDLADAAAAVQTAKSGQGAKVIFDLRA